MKLTDFRGCKVLYFSFYALKLQFKVSNFEIDGLSVVFPIYIHIFDRSRPLRVKFSSQPHTVITRDDLYVTSSGLATPETQKTQETDLLQAQRDRFFQEQEHNMSWFRENKTADLEVVYQSFLSQQHCLQDMLRRYASVLDPNPFTRVLGIGGNTRSQFDVKRDYNLSEPLWCLDFAAPRLFPVLPSDLDAWDDNDVTTHTFRLYFLCDFKYRKEYDHKSHSVLPQSKIRPEHIHLSGHQG
jgi:hypothetical protein